MTKFLEIKSLNPSFREDQIAKELGCSSGTLQRYRQDINMLSAHTVPPNSHKRRQTILNTYFGDSSNREHDLKKPQMTSKDANEKDEPVSKKKETKSVLVVIQMILLVTEAF